MGRLKFALEGQERVLGFAHADTQKTLRLLCELLERRGDAEAARQMKEQHQAQIPVAKDFSPDSQNWGPVAAIVSALYIVPAWRRQGLGKATMGYWKGIAKG